MKRKVLAVLVPVLLSAGAVNAAEIYNKDGNKFDLYGKMVGEHIWDKTDDSNSENVDTSYARFGIKGETQISDDLTGFGQFEYNMTASAPEGEQGIGTEAQRVLDLLLAELPLKRAAALASEITGVRKNLLYQVALEKQKEQ